MASAITANSGLVRTSRIEATTTSNVRLRPQANGDSSDCSTCSNVSLANAAVETRRASMPPRTGTANTSGSAWQQPFEHLGSDLVGGADQRAVARRAVEHRVELGQLTEPQSP